MSLAAARASQSRIEEVIEEPPARTQNIQLVCNTAEHRQPVHNTAEDTQPVQNVAELSQLTPNTTEYPFRRAKNASYVPAVSKGTGVQQAGNKKQEPAFRMLPLVHDAAIASDMYKCTMKLPITITQCELLLLSPEVCA